MTTITPVILCGGSGTQLWPLSRKSFPKQFVSLIGGKSLLQLTLERIAQLGSHAAASITSVAAEAHRFFVAEATLDAKVSGLSILEPSARNTAAAMGLAALAALPEQLLMFCPADHHIPDAKAFAAMVQQGQAAARQGRIVTFGVMPSFPSTAYGYIQQGEVLLDGRRPVARFIEKPAADQTQALILQGDVLWNAGFFSVHSCDLAQSIATARARHPGQLPASHGWCGSRSSIHPPAARGIQCPPR